MECHATDREFTQVIAQKVEKAKLHKETRVEYMTVLDIPSDEQEKYAAQL